MSKAKKYYVVWEGHKPGIYDSWAKCQQQIKGFPNAKFKSFESRKIAEKALKAGIENIAFDRNGYLYHGRVKALADGAREAGLKF